MARRNICYGFIGSFNPKFYKEISSQSFGRSFGYLVLFVLLFSLVFSVKYTVIARTFIQEFEWWIKSDFAMELSRIVPEINITDGEVSSPEEQPFVYELDEFVFILDTTGNTISLDEYLNGIFITKYKFITKKTEGGTVKIEEYDIPKINSFNLAAGKSEGEIIRISIEGQRLNLTDKMISGWIDATRRIILPLIPIFLFLYCLIANLIHLMLFSLISLIIDKITDARLKFSHLLNIGVYVITPSAILAELFRLCGVSFPLHWIIYLIVYIIFLSMAITQVRSRSIG